MLAIEIPFHGMCIYAHGTMIPIQSSIFAHLCDTTFFKMMNQQPVKKYLGRVLTLSLVVILAGGGVALLLQGQQGSTAIFADSASVVGSPSLPAAYVETIFQRVGSPMVGTGQAVEDAARAQNIDDAFALAVWWTETNDGAAGVGLVDRNPGSVRGSIGYPSAFDGYTIYPSYTAAVNYWFTMLKKVYIELGLTTVYAIAHPYVGTSTSDLWAGKVFALMQRYRSEAPPPPTPVPTIAPDIARQGAQLAQEQRNLGQGKSTYYPPVTQNAQNENTLSSEVLSGKGKVLLVIFTLLLALVLAVWAWSVSRRYARRVQPANALWQEIREQSLHGQQSLALVGASAGTKAPTTGDLVPPWRITEDLSPVTDPAEVVEVETTPLPAWFPFQEAFVFEPLPTGPEQSWSDRYPQTPAPQAHSLALSSSPVSGHKPLFSVPTTECTPALPPSLSPSTPALRKPAGTLRRTRLQPHAQRDDHAGQQPQPVGVGVGNNGGKRANGLLSRYRETQA